MSELDDLELVKRAQAGSLAAVGELYDRHHANIFRYLYYKTADFQTAQDLTGELFLRMVNHLDSFEPRGVPFAAWLYRIARNLMLKEAQKGGRQPLVSLDTVETLHSQNGEGNPAKIMERNQQSEWLRAGLNSINERQREVIVLRFIAGLSLKETAGVLDRTVGAVKTLQHRGILALKVALKTEKKVSLHE